MTPSIFKIEKEDDFLKVKDEVNINELNEHGQNALWNASRDKIAWLVKHGIDVNHIDKKGRNLVFVTKNMDLVDYGLDINQIDNEGHSAFYNASRYKIKALINANFDFNKHNDLSYLKYEQLKTLIIFLPVEILKNIKIDVNAQNQQRNNILFGINHLNDEKVLLLIEKGCDVNHFNRDKRNPTYQSDISKLKILIDKGAEIDYLDIYNKNLLFYIDDIELLNFVLKHEFNNKNALSRRKGKNALFSANFEKTKILLQNGFKKEDVNVRNKTEGQSSLFMADENKSKLLIKHGADVNFIDKAGANALFYSSLEKTKILVKAGINVNIINKRNELALWVTHCKETEDFLIANGAKIPSKLVERYKEINEKRCHEMLVRIEKTHLIKNISMSEDDIKVKKRI